jgi:hypothetical protein
MREHVLAALFGAVAALIKGPFGLLPLVGAYASRCLANHNPRLLLAGALTTSVAALPLTAFLASDHFLGTNTWWSGYVERQVLSSAFGRRPDGVFEPWFPIVSIAGRFWPGLPLVVAGAWFAVRRERWAVLVTVFAGTILLGLCLPARKWWNHELVAYPALSLVAGAGAVPLLRQIGKRALRYSVLVLSCLALGFCAAGFGARLLLPPCVASAEFSSIFASIPPGEPILVVASGPEWRTMAGLAAERQLAPIPATSLPGEGARWALARQEQLSSPGASWTALRRARGWVILSRTGP